MVNFSKSYLVINILNNLVLLKNNLDQSKIKNTFEQITKILDNLNTFDGKNELPLGSGGLQSPLNDKIQVLVHADKIDIIAGTSTITVLQDGNITLTKGTTNIQVGSNITMSIQGTQVATLSQSSVEFLVPVKMPTGSMVNNKLIAVVGGTTTGSATTQTITNAGQ